MIVEYRHNNSGGKWWLTDEDWRKLEAAGWKVKWAKDEQARYATPVDGETDRQRSMRECMLGFYRQDAEGNWRSMGALADHAELQCETPGDAMRSFEAATRQKVTDEGCNCCGAPHIFSWPNGYASGESCLAFLFPNKKIPSTLREAIEG